MTALEALKTGGIILADEVGLGKTIEAGLVIKYLIKGGANRILIVVPNALRKQWQEELKDKFDINSYIPGNKYSITNRDRGLWRIRFSKDDPVVVILQYGLADYFINRFPRVSWDCFVFDEAHRLRNLGNGPKMPQRLYNATKAVPKLMLTATPLQNTLRELYALSLYIDENIFVNEETFNNNFLKTEDFSGLKEEIKPIIHRTLRKDVSEYMKFSSRYSFTMDFQLTKDEANLYELANRYLQKPRLYAVTTQNNGLVKMVVRKLLASSSFAVVETFEKLKNRLLILLENTKVERADTSLASFFELIDLDGEDCDDYEEDDIELIERERYRKEIQKELEEIENIIEVASKIDKNSKSNAVIDALRFAFELQSEMEMPNKALIFTESKRTQKYLVDSLIGAGYDSILVFNGEMSDPETRKIYNAWRARNPGKVSNSPNIDLKHAIVEEFRDNAEILIATDVASEGLNLQFCDTVINYDLPWNPMKIEQRIGRCHRYGQTRNVLVLNLLNTENAADKRVYEILDTKFHLFKGVFGASDDALGLLESGSNFERKIQNIYDNCRTEAEFNKEFTKLEREINAKRNRKSRELRNILLSVSSDEKKKKLNREARKMASYLEQIEQWQKITKNIKPTNQKTTFLSGHEIKFKFHKDVNAGYVFVGSFVDSKTSDFLLPVLTLFDQNGQLITSEPYEIIQAFKYIPHDSFVDYDADEEEMTKIFNMYQKLPAQMKNRYLEFNDSAITNNKQRLENWAINRMEQYNSDSENIRKEIVALRTKKELSNYFQEKIEIQRKIDKKKTLLAKRDDKSAEEKTKIENEMLRQHYEFIDKIDIDGIVFPNMVIKFQEEINV